MPPPPPNYWPPPSPGWPLPGTGSFRQQHGARRVHGTAVRTERAARGSSPWTLGPRIDPVPSPSDVCARARAFACLVPALARSGDGGGGRYRRFARRQTVHAHGYLYARTTACTGHAVRVRCEAQGFVLRSRGRIAWTGPETCLDIWRPRSKNPPPPRITKKISSPCLGTVDWSENFSS